MPSKIIFRSILMSAFLLFYCFNFHAAKAQFGGPCSANISYTPNGSPLPMGTTVDFAGMASGFSFVYSYQWRVNAQLVGSMPSLQYTFNTPGSYFQNYHQIEFIVDGDVFDPFTGQPSPCHAEARVLIAIATPPVVTPNQTFTLVENSPNGAVVGTLAATDADGSVTNYFISGGNTDNAFAINQATGQITVANPSALDFETLQTFTLTVYVTDNEGNASATETIVINVSNVNESPYDLFLSNSSIPENNAINAVIGSMTTFDPDAGGSYTYSISGPDAAAFHFAGAQLQASMVFDYETKNLYEIIIRTTDQGGEFVEATFYIQIEDVVEANPVVTFGGVDLSVNEGATGYTTHAFPVTLTGAVAFPVVVRIAPSGTASFANTAGADWWMTGVGVTVANVTGATITFTANGTRTVNLIVYGDGLVEPDETAMMTLSVQTAGVTISGATTHSRTILNDDVANNASLDFAPATPSVSVAEGNSGTQLVQMRVILANANSFPVTAQIGYAGSSALFGNTFGRDFHFTGLNASNQLVLNNNGVYYFNVVVMGDVTFEADELVNLTLGSPTPNVVVNNGSRTVTILNDDPMRFGAEGADSEKLSLYPNPSVGLFNLNIWSAAEENASIKIVDMTGKQIQSRNANLIEGQNLIEFDLTSEAKGVYLVEILTTEGLQRARIVIH